MKKRNNIIYWVSTTWLTLGMISSAIVQLLKTEEETAMITRLGYPIYFLSIIAVWKLLGSIAILLPRFPLIKEWAYAGFFFIMSGALISHAVTDDEAKDFFGPLLLLLLTLISWYFRPENRRLALTP